MPDRDENQPYLDAVANLRDTAKWIMSSSAALAVLILGGTSLNGLGSLEFGLRLWLEIGSSVVSIAFVALIMAMAVRVLASTKGINIDALATEREFARHRQYLDSEVLKYLLAPYQTLVVLRDTYNMRRAALPNGSDAFQICNGYVTYALTVAKWLDVTYRFRAMNRVFIVSLVFILIAMYAFIWAANPPKDIGKDLERPLAAQVAFPVDGVDALRAAGFAQNCVQPTLHVLIYKERPANIVEAYTLPDKSPMPSVTCPIRKIVYDPKTLTILQIQ
jgi:hypothetical protein